MTAHNNRQTISVGNVVTCLSMHLEVVIWRRERTVIEMTTADTVGRDLITVRAHDIPQPALKLQCYKVWRKRGYADICSSHARHLGWQAILCLSRKLTAVRFLERNPQYFIDRLLIIVYECPETVMM